jgi:hypothetical protein
MRPPAVVHDRSLGDDIGLRVPHRGAVHSIKAEKLEARITRPL